MDLKVFNKYSINIRLHFIALIFTYVTTVRRYVYFVIALIIVYNNKKITYKITPTNFRMFVFRT